MKKPAAALSLLAICAAVTGGVWLAGRVDRAWASSPDAGLGIYADAYVDPHPGQYTPPDYTVRHMSEFTQKQAAPAAGYALSMEEAAAIGVRLLVECYGADLNGQTLVMAETLGGSGGARRGWRGDARIPDEADTGREWVYSFSLIDETGEVYGINRVSAEVGQWLVSQHDNFRPPTDGALTAQRRIAADAPEFLSVIGNAGGGYTGHAVRFAADKGLMPDVADAELRGLVAVSFTPDLEPLYYIADVTVSSPGGRRLLMRFLADTKGFVSATDAAG
jgi:hypothetical protein